MTKLIVKTYKGKKIMSYQCVAEGCDHLCQRAPQSSRVLKHATKCSHLENNHHDLWQEALDTSGDHSLGAQLEALDLSVPSKLNLAASLPNVSSGKHPKLLPGQTNLNVNMFKAAGEKIKAAQTEILQSKIDHCIMRLICVCGDRKSTRLNSSHRR